MQALEQRQLLFALTVTPADVGADGLGTVQAYFGYVVQALQPEPTQPATGETRTEDFNDDNVGPVFSGRVFLQSGLALIHNIPVASNIRVVAQRDDQGQDTQERWLEARVGANQFVEFRFVDPQGQNAGLALAARTFSFDARRLTQILGQPPRAPGNGLDTDLFRVEMRLQGRLIDTIQGTRLVAASDTGTGVGRFSFTAPGDTPAFDEIRFVSSGPAGAFEIDNVSFGLPGAQYAQQIDGRCFGAVVTLTGPVGASAQITDLYGRDMVRTLQLGIPPRSQIALVDLDDNGIPNFNDGIGQVRLSGTDSRTSFSMWGTTIEKADGEPPANSEYNGDGPFYPILPGAFAGLYDEFESAGFGYQVDQNGVIGLPGGPGSVIVGSPFVRSLTNYQPDGRAIAGATVTDGFVRPDQGIKLEDGSSIGEITIHGVVHGSSRLSGAVDSLNIGYLVGSMLVDGDVGSMVLGADAGRWTSDDGAQTTVSVKTRSQIVVGRTLGELSIGGRSSADVTVIGDLNSPQTRPPRNIFDYYEKEYAYGFDPATQEGVRAATRAGFAPIDLGGVYRGFDHKIAFSGGVYRNDTIMSSEYIGSTATAVRIKGDIGGADPVDPEDNGDTFAFAVDGSQAVTIEGDSDLGLRLHYRILDADGRVVASTQDQLLLPGNRQASFRPNAPGVYYLNIIDPLGAGNDGFGPTEYTVLVSGIAPTTLGMFRTAGSAGGANQLANSLTVLSGSVGTIRVGTGSSGAGGDGGTGGASNQPGADADAALDWLDGFYSVPGNLYNVTAGSDFAATTETSFVIGGDVGSIYVGMSPVAGVGVNEGDFNSVRFSVGGRIGNIDVRGGVGMNQDNENDPRGPIGIDTTNIVTGTGGGRGDIGFIRVGFHVAGDTMNVRTSSGSTIGAILTSQDVYTDTDPRSGIYLGSRGLPVRTGPGSDVRFVDYSFLDSRGTFDQYFTLRNNVPLEIIDDGGSRVRITVSGIAADAPPQNYTVRVLPIDGSQGVAIGQIGLAALPAGSQLRIEGVGNAGTVGIGRLLVGTADPTAQVLISGNVEIDVYRVEIGGTLGTLSNTTPNGDFVAVDAAGLNNLIIETGDLGRTQVPAFGPQLIGPYIGLDSSPGGAVRGPVGFAQDQVSLDWGGGIYRGTANANYQPGTAFIEDIGSVLNDYLNGLVVRGGGLASARVGGAIGNIVLQGGEEASLAEVVANADGITPEGEFDGIIGTIFAFDIASIDIGDGLAARTSSPLSSTSIVAQDDIGRVFSSIPGAGIRSTVIAWDATANDGSAFAINQIELNGGDFVNAFIASDDLDSFWIGNLPYNEPRVYRGAISSVTGTNGSSVISSEISALNIASWVMPDGVWDATSMSVGIDLGTLTMREFRNSTLNGSDLELRFNEVVVAGSISRMGTTGGLGDIVDLEVDVAGSITAPLEARNITRSKFGVDGEIIQVLVQNIRASEFEAGAVTRVTAANDIVSSRFAVSGRVQEISAGRRILNSDIAVTGPDGQLDRVTAGELISGSISSTGEIAEISSGGDIIGSVGTTQAGADVLLIQAGRDAAVSTDIAGDLHTLTAGRHVGSRTEPGVIIVRGDIVNEVTAGAGQLYNEVRVGGSIAGTITVGAAAPNKLGDNQVGAGSIIAAGRINQVKVQGDFNGDIISYSGGLGTVEINSGSFFPGRTIAAYEGSIENVVINGGHLLGNVYAEFDIVSFIVAASGDGVFGDVGINPALSSATGYDGLRNQLPVGLAQQAAYQGPRIEAGRNIVNFDVSGGGVFESSFIAGWAINRINIAEGVGNDTLSTGFGSFFAAGDSIDNIAIGGSAIDTRFIAGVTGFGADNRPAGIVGGPNADILKPGIVNSVSIGGNADRVTVTAGVTAGADGLYNTPDDRVVLGQSRIETVRISGGIGNVTAYADEIGGGLQPGIVAGGFDLPSENALIDNGQGTPGVQIAGGGQTFNVAGVDLFVQLSGPGVAFYDSAANKVTIRGTDGSSDLLVTANGAVANLAIVSSDEASLRSLSANIVHTGTPNIVIDGSVGTADLGVFTGNFSAGGDVGSITTGDLASGSISAGAVGALFINGNFGNTARSVTGEVRVQLRSVGPVTVAGATRGLISVDRDAGAFVSNGPVERASLRVGGSLASFAAPSVLETIVSVRNTLGSVSVAGDATDTAFIAGIDLGTDGLVGGTGLAADVVTTGFIGDVTIGGNFRESDVVAGLSRGADGFFGSADDLAAGGRSSIGNVTIAGTQVGSNRSSERYRVASTGTVGTVRVANQTITSRGNFAVQTVALAPVALQVDEIKIDTFSRVFTATIRFNQPVDQSTLGPSLSVSEVRGVGDVTIRLIEGIDYTLTYDETTNTALITFARSIIDQDLPSLPGRPAANVYRFQFDDRILRAKVASARLDGDGDGFVEQTDRYSADDIVGDAGDKLVPQRFTLSINGEPQPNTYDLYGPMNLNLVLDNNTAPNGLPDPGTSFTIRGFIGDHPDNDSDFFRFSGDVDLYSITLQAGQIFSIGAIQGAAQFASVVLLDASGNPVDQFSAGAAAAPLPIGTPGIDFSPIGAFTGATFLMKVTGTYILAVSSSAVTSADITDPNSVPNPDVVPGTVGDYSLAVSIFDDLDSGFNGNTDSGDGRTVVPAPGVVAFVGPDLLFNTPDDLSQIVIGSYVFTLNRGADGLANTADDLVSGTDSNGVTTTRDATGREITLISAAIGPEGHAGVPSEFISPDVDVYHLNSRSAINPGTKMRVTIKLAELGADLGTRQLVRDAGAQGATSFDDFRGEVLFGLFDTSNSVSQDDGRLVFSPTDFRSTGGVPDTLLASNGSTTYGYDANGDYYIEFVIPDRLGQAGSAGTFALYVQGVFNTDYQIEVVTDGTGETVKNTQNVLIETGGGDLDWLSVFGFNTSVGAFNARTLGFSGSLSDGTPVQTYLLNQLVASLNAIYRGAGFDVNFSTNPNDFEFQDFSTVFLTSTPDPLNLVFGTLALDFFGTFDADAGAFSSTQPYGVSRRSDPLNADLNDDAVVFVPSFSLLGLSSSQADLDRFVQSLSGAIGRRVGELTGLRITSDNPAGTATPDVMAADSPTDVPGPGRAFTIPNASRALSDSFDSITGTNFFLGRQSDASLLDSILGRI
jgi:hypothetical protein